MGKIQTFKDLLVWQKSHELVLLVYHFTNNFPKNEEFSLTSQIRRASVSIPSNLAEGFKRSTKKESLRFYNISEASLEEVKYQLLLSRDLGYLTDSEYNKIEELSIEVSKLLCGWVKCQKSDLNFH